VIGVSRTKMRSKRQSVGTRADDGDVGIVAHGFPAIEEKIPDRNRPSKQAQRVMHLLRFKPDCCCVGRTSYAEEAFAPGRQMAPRSLLGANMLRYCSEVKICTGQKYNGRQKSCEARRPDGAQRNPGLPVYRDGRQSRLVAWSRG
jgi:hypothetical protein